MENSHREYRILFQPERRAVFVLPHTTIFEAAARLGLLLKTPCAGRGTCGGCRVRLVEGACPPSAACREHLSETAIEHGWRLACQAAAEGDCTFEIPDEVRFETSARILVAAEKREFTLRPALAKRYLELPAPSADDPVADLTRLERALDQSLKASPDVLRELPETLRQSQFKGTVATYGHRLLAFEPGDTTGRAYGLAFDLGTTTMVGTLMDLTDGRELAVATALNPQIPRGDDVISRILAIREDARILAEMQQAVVDSLNRITAETVEQAGVKPREVYEFAVAGNTAMQHIFCGISPAALGEIPFTPVFQRGLQGLAAKCGLRGHPEAMVYVFPHIGGFVGGDTVAGGLAALMHTGRRHRALVDIGTNGEIMVALNGRLLAASTAAGPAFEGARIVDGMRAADGAIEKVVLAANDGDLDYNVIGNRKPVGLCGTGLIDTVAELLRLRVIDHSGLILPAAELPPETPPAIRQRIVENEKGQCEFRIVAAAQTRHGRDIRLRQKDVRELQLASGALRAGLNMLLARAELPVEELDEVLLAGAFGNFIRRRNARRIGLLPQVPLAKVKFIGNAASMGAKLALLSREVRELAESMARRTQHVDLSADPEFQMQFAEAMLFPGEDFSA